MVHAGRYKAQAFVGSPRAAHWECLTPIISRRASVSCIRGAAAGSEANSSISSGLSIIGKIVGQGKLAIFGHVEGEVRFDCPDRRWRTSGGRYCRAGINDRRLRQGHNPCQPRQTK